jgi:hypothetical protein
MPDQTTDNAQSIVLPVYGGVFAHTYYKMQFALLFRGWHCPDLQYDNKQYHPLTRTGSAAAEY